MVLGSSIRKGLRISQIARVADGVMVLVAIP